MNIDEMVRDALDAKSKGQEMTLVVPRPFKGKPKGFPCGELLCEQTYSNVNSYDPDKILNWLDKNGLYNHSSAAE